MHVQVLGLFIFILSFSQNAAAQIILKPFEPRFKTEQPGGIVYVSNNILSCDGCSAVNQSPPSGSSDNNDFYSKYIDIDNSPQTFSSSSADLALPECSSISFAGLYWGGAARSNNPRLSEKNQVKLKIPGSDSYVDLVADVNFGLFEDQHYQYFKDVTSLLNENAVTNGTYTVANVVANENTKGVEAGWTLVIVYRQDQQPVRNLTVFDGFVGIPSNAPDLEIPISGFLTPPSGPVSFELGFVGYEGDRGLTGDYLHFNKRSIRDAAHSATNTFNSSITRNGAVVTSRSPAYRNTLGYDASIIEPDNSSFTYLGNSATSANITIATDEDRYTVGVVSTAIDVYNPYFQFTHSFKNLAGGAQVSPGNEIVFEYELKNVGIDKSTNTTFVDSLPVAFDYVPGSLEVQYNNGQWMKKTDGINDDESEYDVRGNRVIFRLGSGATSSQGGVIDPNAIIKVRYHARLTADCDLLRCIGSDVSKYGQLNYSGNINNDNKWQLVSTTRAEAGTCTTSGPLKIGIDIPKECLALPAERHFTLDCPTDVSAFELPIGYELYASQDSKFTTPVRQVTASGEYIARRVVSSGCEYLFKVHVTINTVKILSQPASIAVCEGEEASFKVGALGTGNFFQWQKETGAGLWTDIPGATDSIFKVEAVNGANYRAIVRRSCGPSEISLVARLEIIEKATILSELESVSACEGQDVNLVVKASGEGLRYQWQRFEAMTGWKIIEGATNDSLEINAVTTNLDGSRYRAIVNSSCGILTTSEAMLTVTGKIVLNTQPQSVTICEGDTAVFSVGATGANLTYQWQILKGGSWSDIPRATNSSLEVRTTQNGSKYRVIVKSTCGSLASSEADLNVTEKLVLTTQPQSVTVCEGATAVFSVGATGANLTYQWQTFNGGSWIDVPGATNTSLEVRTTRNGSKYRVIVSSSCGSLASSEADLSVTEKPLLITQLKSVTVCEGDAAVFSVGATGVNLTYQWQRFNGDSWIDLTGSTGATLTLSAVTADRNHSKYRVVVNSTCGSLVSNEATLSIIKKAEITQQLGSLTVCEGGNATFTVKAFADKATYQWQSGNGVIWTNIPGATSATLTLNALTAQKNGSMYRVMVTNECGTIISEAGVLTVTPKPTILSQPVAVTICEGENAAFTVKASGNGLTYQWQRSAGGTNWTNITDANGPSLVVKAVTEQNGFYYRVIITGSCGTLISEKVHSWAKTDCNIPPLTDLKKPKITAQPSAVIICEGDPATFTIQALGENLKYQWQQLSGSNWMNIPNETGSSLTLTSVKATQNGTLHRVLVSNAHGITLSAEALLTVNSVPKASVSSFKLAKGSILNGSLAANDSDNDALMFNLVTPPGQGSLTIMKDGSFQFVPTTNWVGTTSAVYSVTDGKCSTIAQITFTVAESQVPPVSNDDTDPDQIQPAAKNDYFQTDINKPVSASVATNDAINEVENPEFSTTSLPANGTLKFSKEGTFEYFPNAGFTGVDNFTYQVCAPNGLCSSATVEIKVIPFTVVNLSPGLSHVTEGGRVSVTATLERPFNEDLTIKVRYKGKAIKGDDYHLSDQFETLRIRKGQVTTSDRITIFAAADNNLEDVEDLIVEIDGTSNANVRPGTGAVVLISNSDSSFPVVVTPGNENGSGDDRIAPQPLVSPNGDNNNDYFQIKNIDAFPNNEVVIFNRWGNEVFRVRGYHEGSGNVFKGNANRGLLLGSNETLPDGVYYYIVTPDTKTASAASELYKGYLILKRN